MTKKANEKKKGPLKKFLSLMKKAPGFFRTKESVEEYTTRKKAEAKIMIDAVQELMRTQRGSVSDTIYEYTGDDQEEIYLYDFLSEAYNGGGITSNDGFAGVVPMAPGEPFLPEAENRNHVLMVSDSIAKKEPKRVYKPIEVFKELETIPAPVNLENIDEKIAVLKLKKEFIKSNRYAKKEVIDMATRLENRKRYPEFESFFSKFDNTTTDKVNDLVNKYDLVLRTSDLFIPKFPKEAMDIMKEYKENVKKLCNKSPVFYVIAEKALFKSEEKRNDPILLVQSPFGIYWQILGAWDKELVLLEEL